MIVPGVGVRCRASHNDKIWQHERQLVARVKTVASDAEKQPDLYQIQSLSNYEDDNLFICCHSEINQLRILLLQQ